MYNFEKLLARQQVSLFVLPMEPNGTKDLWANITNWLLAKVNSWQMEDTWA